MQTQHPTSEDLESYQKVSDYLDNKEGKDNDSDFSLFPKPNLLWAVVIAAIAFLCYYGLTTLLFGQEFWVESLMGK